MKNMIKFLMFIAYSTCVFFMPNNKLVLLFIIINIISMFFTMEKMDNIIKGTLNILPFVLFTFIINIILDNFINAVWIGIKLIIVCNITITYSNTTTIMRNSRNNTIIMYST